jgi:hypothetical protein
MPGYKLGRFSRGWFTQYRHNKAIARFYPEQPLITYGSTDAISIFSDRVVVSTLTTTDVVPLRLVVKMDIGEGEGEDWITLTCTDESHSLSRQVWAALKPGEAVGASPVIGDLGKGQGLIIPTAHRPWRPLGGLIVAILAGVALAAIAILLRPWGILALPLWPVMCLAVTQFLAARRRAWRPVTPS